MTALKHLFHQIFSVLLRPAPAIQARHPRCDACRVVAARLDSALREADSKLEHLGLEIPVTEVTQIVTTVCRDENFRYSQVKPNNISKQACKLYVCLVWKTVFVDII